MSYKMLDQRLKYEKALNIKKTRPNWARKVRDLDMGDGNGEQVKVVFDIDVHHVHEWERLHGLEGGRKRWN